MAWGWLLPPISNPTSSVTAILIGLTSNNGSKEFGTKTLSLRIMEGYGLDKFKRDVHGVEPVALATRFKILID